MEVMGPERVTHNSEGEVGEEERPGDGTLLPVWSGGEEEEEGGDMELDGEEEEHEEQHNEGYYYQPLTQEPEQPGEEGEDRGEELEEVHSRMQVSSAVMTLNQFMSLHPHYLSPAGDGAPSP